MHAQKNPLPTHEVRRLSVQANVDPRTLLRVLRGQRTAGMTRERIVAALKAAGYGHLVPEHATVEAQAQ